MNAECLRGHVEKSVNIYLTEAEYLVKEQQLFSTFHPYIYLITVLLITARSFVQCVISQEKKAFHLTKMSFQEVFFYIYICLYYF